MAGVHAGQPASKAASKVSHEARRSSEECLESQGLTPSRTDRHETPKTSRFGDFDVPFPRSGAPPEKKYHLGSGLNQRDRAALGNARASHPAKPTKIFDRRGCGYGDWCRCRFVLGKIPGSSAKKRRQGGHYNHFGCMQVGWRWNSFSFLSAEKIVPS